MPSELNLMDSPSSSMRDLARRLLAACQTASGSPADEAAVVVEKLRLTLIKFAGTDGFTSLMRRALVLARADVPALKFVKIDAEGRLEGLEQIVADQATNEAAVAITSHLLGLLVTFIGEPLTVGLVRAAWPDTSLNDEHSRIEPHS